jgi:UDP-2-acetamido-2,6-beta-L-arabino-hexul-4-ose reductase
MKVLITGASGFIGKNLCLRLAELGYVDVVKVGSDISRQELATLLKDADFVYHLAGINRPKNGDDFSKGNAELTAFIANELVKNDHKIPIMLSSSTQAINANPYGISKAAAESAVESYAEHTGANHFIYRLPNVFGKWCRPNYNSFVATFCHNLISGADISVHDPKALVTLVHIDDVCEELSSLLGRKQLSGFRSVKQEYLTTVGEVASILRSFKYTRESLVIERVGTGLTRALYSTYLSYLPASQFSYQVPRYSDERGTFCEMLKTKDSGQFSFFTAHPGVTRGGHYHHSKTEKFLIVKGEACFKFRHIITGEFYELFTNGDKSIIVETVPGWTHDVTNVGEEEMIVMLWANEIFDKNKPDTYPLSMSAKIEQI